MSYSSRTDTPCHCIRHLGYSLYIYARPLSWSIKLPSVQNLPPPHGFAENTSLPSQFLFDIPLQLQSVVPTPTVPVPDSKKGRMTCYGPVHVLRLKVRPCCPSLRSGMAQTITWTLRPRKIAVSAFSKVRDAHHLRLLLYMGSMLYDLFPRVDTQYIKGESHDGAV